MATNITIQMYDKTQTNPPTNVWQNTNKSSYKCTEKWDMTKHKQILLQMYWEVRYDKTQTNPPTNVLRYDKTQTNLPTNVYQE
jgi:hypothetical protein